MGRVLSASGIINDLGEEITHFFKVSPTPERYTTCNSHVICKLIILQKVSYHILCHFFIFYFYLFVLPRSESRTPVPRICLTFALPLPHLTIRITPSFSRLPHFLNVSGEGEGGSFGMPLQRDKRSGIKTAWVHTDAL